MTKNINITKNNLKNSLSAEEYLTEIQKGNRAILSKAITLIESSNPCHQKIAEKLIELCLPLSGNSLRIGITGVPGVGKSTFIEALGTYLIDEKSKKVAVLAIDPSSTQSKGSILGDKTRMNKLAVKENAFIRPSPSSGALGGVAKATRETIILCETAGYNTILIETVGVGQSEIEVKSMVDFFLLLMLTGAGDELQGIKRGIMEIADTIIINKADGNNIEQAKLTIQEYKNAIHLFPPMQNKWTPKVSSCSALENKNINEVWNIIEHFFDLIKSNGYFIETRKQQAKRWFKDAIKESISSIFYNNEDVKKLLTKLEQQVVNQETSPYKAAQILISSFKMPLDKTKS